MKLLLGIAAGTICIDTFLKILLGMHHLAKERICHRDLACRNILLDANMTPKITDFGNLLWFFSLIFEA
jgi:serine/threonine protein kinase